MLLLPDLQTHFASALRRGPARVPVAAFRGSLDRILLGFKVHANTISHARLVALEETFPRLHAAMGAARFNRLSRRFVDSGGGAGQSLAMLGRSFPDWLAGHQVGTALICLARAEWAWLTAYRAADAAPLTMADLARLDEAALLKLPVGRHPAAQLVRAERRTLQLLNLARGSFVLITRPDVVVEMNAATPDDALLFAALVRPATLGALLALPVPDPLALITRAVTAGLLIPLEN